MSLWLLSLHARFRIRSGLLSIMNHLWHLCLGIIYYWPDVSLFYCSLFRPDSYSLSPSVRLTHGIIFIILFWDKMTSIRIQSPLSMSIIPLKIRVNSIRYFRATLFPAHELLHQLQPVPFPKATVYFPF